jgi:hypothetical protein
MSSSDGVIMPIPAFDGILNVLPPHLGKDGTVDDLSPYKCTMQEVCERFATSPERITILKGVLALRNELWELNLRGFQWMDGSFVEDIEVQESRNPGDIDIVTFYEPTDGGKLFQERLQKDPSILQRTHVKATFHADHFWLPLGTPPVSLVEQTRYWYGLFSHRRDRTWKGMLQVGLSEKDDPFATKILEAKS